MPATRRAGLRFEWQRVRVKSQLTRLDVPFSIAVSRGTSACKPRLFISRATVQRATCLPSLSDWRQTLRTP